MTSKIVPEDVLQLMDIEAVESASETEEEIEEGSLCHPFLEEVAN